MTFNSYIFILLFLPCFVIGFFLTKGIHKNAKKVFLIISGFLFYSYGGIKTTLVFGISIILNLIMSSLMERL